MCGVFVIVYYRGWCEVLIKGCLGADYGLMEGLPINAHIAELAAHTARRDVGAVAVCAASLAQRRDDGVRSAAQRRLPRFCLGEGTVGNPTGNRGEPAFSTTLRERREPTQAGRAGARLGASRPCRCGRAPSLGERGSVGERGGPRTTKAESN